MVLMPRVILATWCKEFGYVSIPKKGLVVLMLDDLLCITLSFTVSIPKKGLVVLMLQRSPILLESPSVSIPKKGLVVLMPSERSLDTCCRYCFNP